MIWFLLACTATPDDDALVADDTASPEDSAAPSDTSDTGAPPGDACPATTSTDDYDAYPVFIDGTDRRFVTIQDGIWGAADGDTVVVCPGTYEELIDFKGKAITVRSQGGPAVTVIDGQGLGSVVTMRNYEPAESVLAGFTITGGNGGEGHGGGIFVEWGSPVIRHNLVVGNSARIAAGVYVRNGGATVHNNVIAFNHAEQVGGGVVCTACGGSFRYNTIFANESPDGPVGEWYWGVADLVGNIVVLPDGDQGPAIQWTEPRHTDFSTDYNLLWPDVAWTNSDWARDSSMPWPEGEGIVIADPLIVDPEGGDWSLDDNSPAVDAGPVDEADSDGSRSDLGAFGGSDGAWPW